MENSQSSILRFKSQTLHSPFPILHFKTLAITGGVACGKSTLGRLLAERGADVLDADDIVHRHQCSGGRLIDPICAEFGKEMLTPEGAIHRPTLAKRVFTDAVALAKLNAIVHPIVREEFKTWQKIPTDGWAKIGIIPLLFESGWEGDWNFTLCVTCSPEIQRQRASARGWSNDDLDRRLAAQWPLERKCARADIVVDNSANDMFLLIHAADELKWRMERDE